MEKWPSGGRRRIKIGKCFGMYEATRTPTTPLPAESLIRERAALAYHEFRLKTRGDARSIGHRRWNDNAGSIAD